MARKGNQNPTQSVILPTRKSLFKETIELYERSGRKAQTWQKNLMKAIMSTTKGGLWTHTKFGFSLPRRNGKNEICVIRELWGLFHGEQILHTAHRTTTSHAAWERLKTIFDKSEVEYNSLRAIGRERIELPQTGGRIEFRTRTSTGGLGEGFDLLVIDEAQEYTDDQESALKYVVTDSKNPQTLFCGTPPTLVSSGTVFVNFRDSTLDGQFKNAGWAEWGVDEESDVQDKELWYKTNPSLGTIFSERSVEDEIGRDKIDFNIQRLGLWIKYNQKSAISKVDWDKLRVSRVPELSGKLCVGIKYGNNGVNVAMSIAVKTVDGRSFVESIDCQSVRMGTDWIVRFLKTADVSHIVIDGQSGQRILEEELKRNGIRQVSLPTVQEIIVANAMWEKGIYEETICHKAQPSLEATVTNCLKRTIGSNGGFGYKSQFEDYDIALMDSALLAHFALGTKKEVIKQQIRY